MPRGNITIADFSGGGRKTTTAALWQYDYGQILQFSGIEGLPSTYEVHFSNDRVAGEAKTQIGNEHGVTIPDEYFLSGKPIFAWIYLHAGANDGETEYQVTIPINKCSRPADQPPTPVEQSAITQAIAALNEAVEQTETNVAHYPKIEGGYWYVWDATNEEWMNTGVRAEGEGTGIQSVELTQDYKLKIYFTDGTSYITPVPIRGKPGRPGQDGDSPTASVQQTATGATISVTDKTGTTTATIDDGEDGYSPTISITDITGGHRITITDEAGAHSFDVMDGGKGATGNGISSIVKTSSVGLVDTYTITYTDGTSATYTVTNGKDGKDGKDGEDGDSPTASVQQTATGATISVTDKTGTTTATIDDGEDGYSPTISITDITGGHRVTITDKTGPHSFDVMDGEDGQDGVQDVQVAGTSVVSGGVANVPLASPNTPGVVVSGTVAVTGTTPTIAAIPGVRYVCGEVSTLDITLPASGIVDVTFESGSTPTVLTVTPPSGVTLKWANDFDPTALEANTTYEINIMDGIGVAVGVSA